MTPEAARELIHKVNNLLAVIHTQVAVAKVAGTPEAAREALAQIERAATTTGEVVKRARA